MDLKEIKSSNYELMQAQTLLWTHVFNHIDPMSLNCAIELGIPDAIHSHKNPISLPDLLSALSISPSKESHLRRLMQMLTHSGIFAETDQDVYSLTPLSNIPLVKNQDLSLSASAVAMFDPIIMNPFHSLITWFKISNSHDHDTPFSVEHGCGFWGLTDRDPKFNGLFNEAMLCDSKFLMNVFLKDCRHVFDGVGSLVDVGGGTGSAAMAISQAFPSMSCTVLDLSQVIDTVKEKGDVEFVAGDMFDYIPPADAVMLKWILHDWSDGECVKILQRCREAIFSRKGGKVVIFDQVMGKNSLYDQKSSSTTAQIYMDMLMIALTTGVEREEQQWKKLFDEAGFKSYKITPALGFRSIIEVYP